jgi:hypothetical protein
MEWYIVRIEGWNILNKQVEVSKVVSLKVIHWGDKCQLKKIEDDEKEVN